ncbi:QWRF motif-containing protein 3 [Arabidopsis thaliana]|uniref:QWRF family n=1 Tax=Arabidopsis thaliana x Arabidopsis arenosa TaxID=1240361 RepID=A0A8T2FL49_9BRAS|nr:QWRF family [Arabidopsis thaliana x Arabidopsis arenosa]
MKSCEHELLKTRREKSREVSSRFLSSPSASSSPNRRNSTSSSSTKRDDQNNNGLKVHLGLKKHDRMSDGTRVCFGLPNQSSLEFDTRKSQVKLVLQEKIKLQKKNLEMKINYVLLSQVKASWEDMEIQQLSSLSMARDSLHSVLSMLPLKEGAKMEDIVPLASLLAEVAAQEKLMQPHDFLRMISELEMQERSLKCCFLIQHKQTFDTNLL